MVKAFAVIEAGQGIKTVMIASDINCKEKDSLAQLIEIPMRWEPIASSASGRGKPRESPTAGHAIKASGTPHLDERDGWLGGNGRGGVV